MRARLQILVRLLLAVACLAASSAHAEERSLRVGLVALPAALGNPFRDAHVPSSYTTGAIFDGLTRFDENGELQPWLALSWERTNPVTWRFRLRPNVLFQDGSAFTADAVVAAIEYLTSKPAQRDAVARELTQLKTARAIDALTVDVETAWPDPTLPRSLPILWIPQPALWRKLGPEAFARAPIGTGPFKLERFLPTRALLVAHKQAWRPPRMDRLELIAMPDSDTRVQALAARAIDVAVGLGADEIDAIEASGGKSATAQEPSVMGVALIADKGGPLADVRVRRALNLAVNRQLIVDKAMAGKARAASQVAARGVIGNDPQRPPIPYDPARAKALLAEAGHANGFNLVFEVVVGAGDAVMYQQIAADLRRIGVTVELRTIPIQKLLTNVVFGGWSGDGFGLSYDASPSRDALRALRVHSCLWRAPWFCDRALSDRIDAAFHEGDLDRRVAETRALVAAYDEAAPLLAVYEIVRFFGLDPRVAGFAERNNLIDWAPVERR